MYENEMWMNYLSEEIQERFRLKEITKDDIPEMVEVRWDFGSDASKEDALEYILTLLENEGMEDVTYISQSTIDRIFPRW